MKRLGKSRNSSGKPNPAVPLPTNAEQNTLCNNNSVAQRQDIRDTLRDLLLRNDPINVNYGGGIDVYRPEIERITQRLPSGRSPEDFCSVIHEELCNSFGAAVVGGRACYWAMAVELWALHSSGKHV
jgi:hypothetical protein